METIVGNDCNQTRLLLEKGEVVAIPTETVYGLAANGLNETAVLKIFQAKGRPLSNPLILHFSSKESIKPYVLDFPPILEKLADYFWPGPLTLLLSKSSLVPEIITAGLDRVGVRVPAQPLVQELLQSLNFPLAAPSANLYGMISPTQATHVYNQLQGKIPYILDGGACENGIESTIVGFENEQVIVYRLGGISLEQIANVIGYLPQLKNHSENQPVTSGMVKHHYAPNTPFAYLEADFIFEEDNNDGFIRSDLNKGALLNVQDDNLNLYKKQRKNFYELNNKIHKINSLEKELNELKTDMSEIKELLLRVVNK
jgi:L-threonylcarbamoyladenylate synthase